jgi:hypothetical protein
MMILETDKDKEIFEFYWNSEPCLIFPIWCDLEAHPMNNSISFLYVRFRNDETDQGDVEMDYILPFDHNDCEKLEMDLSNSLQQKMVYNKKGLLQTNLNIQNLYDLQSDEFFSTNILFNLNEKIEVLTNFYTRLGLRDGLGKSIPIMKWEEVLREVSTPYEPNLYDSFSDSWINNTMLPVLSKVEEIGIHVVKEKFIDRWSAAQKHVKGDKVYTEYNPYTATSRPSNRHGGVNYGALNKKDGTREMFVPKPNHIFLQLDYDAYHVRIIADMIGYDGIPKTSGHQWLADQYGCGYAESKGITFQILYGGVTDDVRDIPFFDETDKYIQKMYIEAKKVGYVTTGKGRKIMLDTIEKHNAQKVFNYLLQATETELNIEVIKLLHKGGIDSMLLYTYDSFLFEYPENVGTDTAIKIKDIIESLGFPVKASWGDDYSKV